MKHIAKMISAFCLGCVVVAVPVEPLEARKFPSSVKKPRKPPEFKQIKARMKNFKRTGTAAYRNLKGAYRQERQYRQMYERSQFAVLRARNAYQADRNPQNQQRLANAQRSLANIKPAYDRALSTYRNAKSEIRRLDSIQKSNLSFQRQQQGVAPKPPRRARPQFSPRVRVTHMRVGTSVAPSPQAALSGGRNAQYVGLRTPAAQAAPRESQLAQMGYTSLFKARNGHSHYENVTSIPDTHYSNVVQAGLQMRPQAQGPTSEYRDLPNSPQRGGVPSVALAGPATQMYGQQLYANTTAPAGGALRQSAASNSGQSPTAY